MYVLDYVKVWDKGFTLREEGNFLQINSANDASKHGLQAQPAPSGNSACGVFMTCV